MSVAASAPVGAAPASSAAAIKSTDLTAKLIPHLDRHLVLPLLDFLESRGAYSHEQVLKAKYDLMHPTNMVNYVLELKREIDGESESTVVPEGAVLFFSSCSSQTGACACLSRRLVWRSSERLALTLDVYAQLRQRLV